MEQNGGLHVNDISDVESTELLEEAGRILKLVAERRRTITEQNNFVLEEESDKVLIAVKRAINDFAESKESISINNMTPEYVPIAIDKILELSNEVTIFDGTGDFLMDYNEKIQQKVDKSKKITIYHTSLINIQKHNSSELRYISIKPETVQELFGENIRSAIVGDKIRYRVEKSEERPSFKPFKNWFVSLFSNEISDDLEYPIQYKSLTNFFNRNEAEKILRTVEIAANAQGKIVPSL